MSAAAVAVFYNFYVMPAEAELASRQQRLAALRVNINRGLATARKLPEFQREVGELEARLSDLRAVLPEQKDVADLLRHIQTLATQSNLTIRSFKPAPMSTKRCTPSGRSRSSSTARITTWRSSSTASAMFRESST